MNEDLKEVVRNKYNRIAERRNEKKGCGCGCGSVDKSDVDYTLFNDDYSKLKGYNPEADLQLGCGVPTEYAKISRGDTVVDLGSGAGNDAFVARAIVGDEGHVIGLDFADSMLAKARNNVEKLGFTNVEFVKGDIEEMPLKDGIADVVISNCVLNLVPDKKKAFQQIHRILNLTGHFCVSDVVISGDLPESLVKDATLYAGCVSGALKKEEYLGIIQKTGFKNIEVKKDKEVWLPDELLEKHLTEKEYQDFRVNKVGIYSITVYAEK
jgi:arsenite methyltransferase